MLHGEESPEIFDAWASSPWYSSAMMTTLLSCSSLIKRVAVKFLPVIIHATRRCHAGNRFDRFQRIFNKGRNTRLIGTTIGKGKVEQASRLCHDVIGK